MSTEHEFLASAYLDGELTDEERRIAEADPAVMAEVDELLALRDQLIDVQPPSAAARDSAIAAAMGAFHDLHGAAEPVRPAPGPVVPFRRRPVMAQWLSLAAVLLIVAALGFVVAAGIRGGGDDDSADDAATVAEPAAQEPAAEPASDARLTEDADASILASEAGAEEPAAEMATADVPAEESATEYAEEPAAEEPAAEQPAAEEPADTAFVLIDPALNVDEGVPIESPEQLSAVAVFLLQREADGVLGATPEHSCPFERVLDDATWDAGGTPVDILIDVADADNIVRAIDRSTCDIIVEAPIVP